MKRFYLDSFDRLTESKDGHLVQYEEVEELVEEMKKIANTEYCEHSGCKQDKDAKACRDCLKSVALKVLG